MRTERLRLDDAHGNLDRIEEDPQDEAPCLLVQTFDDGAYPTAIPAIFMCHPVRLTGTEEEGDTATLTPDTTEDIPVYVFGTGDPPAIGTTLIAHGVGGRWAAAHYV